MSAVKGGARLIVAAGAAKPSPAIGQALGPLGVNMMEFCKEFNARTADLKPSVVNRVKLIAFEDRTFKFTVLPPSTTWFLKRCTGITKGTATPKRTPHIATIGVKQIYEIAKCQLENNPELAARNISLESQCRSVIASCTTLGIKVVY